MEQEKLKILQMIEEGKLTAKEGAELLNALGKEDDNNLKVKGNGLGGKWLRVKVFESNGKQKVNVNIPLSLVNVGLKIGSKFNSDLKEHLGDINIDEIVEAVKNGAEGKLVEVENEKEGEKVEIFVE